MIFPGMKTFYGMICLAALLITGCGTKEAKTMNAGNIEFFMQNSIRITSGAGKIYADPFQMKEDCKGCQGEYRYCCSQEHGKKGDVRSVKARKQD